jgi:uncharacterized Fe-S cluster protein YjdI
VLSGLSNPDLPAEGIKLKSIPYMKEYKKEDVIILWNSEKCTHSALCAKGLSSVFKPKERPWIQTENATQEEIVNQVLKCPSGALSIKK